MSVVRSFVRSFFRSVDHQYLIIHLRFVCLPISWYEPLILLFKARLPVKWMPPESLFYGESTTMSDV